jgi:hypothetical protein
MHKIYAPPSKIIELACVGIKENNNAWRLVLIFPLIDCLFHCE